MTRDDHHIVILIALLHLITCTAVIVYYVRPDDQSDINDDCPTGHECHTLQYYLLNYSKYFTSNTQLHFLQGNFYINTDMVIENLNNFSLIGSSVNSTSIECSKPSLIAIINCTNTVIKNISTGRRCGALKNNYFDISQYMLLSSLGNEIISIQRPTKKIVTLYVLNSFSTVVQSVLIKRNGIFIINGLGKTMISDVILYYDNIEIFYIEISDGLHNAQNSNTNLLHIINLKYCNDKMQKSDRTSWYYIVVIEFWQKYYSTGVLIENTKFQFLNKIEFISIQFKFCNTMENTIKKFVVIKNCQFLNNTGVPQFDSGMIFVTYPFCLWVVSDVVFNVSLFKTTIMSNMNIVKIANNSFINNTALQTSTAVKLNIKLSFPNISYFTLQDSTFVNNHNFSLLKVQISTAGNMINLFVRDFQNHLCTLTIASSQIMLPSSGEDQTVIYTIYSKLYLNGPLIFANFKNKNANVIVTRMSSVMIHGYVNFINIIASSLLFQIELNSIQLKESLLLHINHSTFSSEIFHTNYTAEFDGIKLVLMAYPLCLFQYVSDRGNLDQKFTMGRVINFSIIIHETEGRSLSNLHTTHCMWQPTSAFNTTDSLLVNQRFISDFDKWNDILNVPIQKSLCSCSDDNSINCTIDVLGPIYPGQNAVFSLALVDGTKQNATETIPIFIETINYSPSQCTVPISLTRQDVSSHGCSNVSYTLLSRSNIICELLLKQTVTTINGIILYYSKFYVNLLPCPPGFSHIQMRCQCDPILVLNGHVKDCDINDQTVLKSPNSWIMYNGLHTYWISRSCPFDYCYPHSSKLNLKYPNSQCQFNRSGILCGQCQMNLSTIFGSPNCQQCSNIYLFLIIAFAVSGIILVITIFVLNLMVSEGNINPFILYANILSIHYVPLFPSHLLIKPLHICISLVNLDLGIETCFYNGMDDYIKTWLQFSFSIYLIMIIISLIIASRYSIMLHRLTLHKSVPVLATILLLSYTKILQTVSNVLFAYSMIADYPRNVSRVVWSIDANVTLFGSHHSFLFAFSLLVFLLLMTYTCMLLFGKYLKISKVMAHMTPLLNAYSKPYKNNCCYWVGFELIIRCTLLGTLLAVNNDTTISLIIGNSFLSVVQFNFQHSFQSKANNISQMLLHLNLLILYSTSLMLSGYHGIRVVVVNVMVGFAVVQFIMMIMIQRFPFKYFDVNVIRYVKQQLLTKKQSGDIDILLTRQDCDNAAND